MQQNGLENLVGLQIGITYSLLTIQLQKMLEPCNLSPKEAVVLWLSAENPGVTQTDIAAFLGVGRATVLQAIRELKKSHWIELRDISHDGRKLGIHVTEAGAEALRRARETIAIQEAEIRSKIAPTACNAVLKSMKLLR